MSNQQDIQVLRALAAQYAEVAHLPVQAERRALWTAHNSLKPTRVPILATFGMWNVWCREMFGDAALACTDPFYREHERWLRLQLFQAAVGDDSIQEPWITQSATFTVSWERLWGVEARQAPVTEEGGATYYLPPLKSWEDVRQLVVPRHAIDEETTRRNVERLQEAVGDILPVNVARGCAYTSFAGDLSHGVCYLRGLEQVMEDMYDAPEELHALMAFMRDGVLGAQQQAEDAGDFSLLSHQNQSMPYCEELEAPCMHSGPRTRKQLWAFFAAQEFTLVSPAMHDEFLLQYQLPIMQHWGLIAYGCCEDLTRKIDMLRQIPNLRQIAVTPVADVAKCAEQIGTDYVMSWRPNPADMVCCGFDEGRIRRIISDGLAKTQGGRVHIHLKDVETLEGEPERLANWVKIVREETACYA